MKTSPILLFLMCGLWLHGQTVQEAGQALQEADRALQETDQQVINKIENGLCRPGTVAVGQSLTKATIEQRMKEEKIHGVSVAVIRDGKVFWTESYGKIGVESENPIEPETLFQAASIGKVITSLAALILVQEGAIGLDDPVNLKLKRWKLLDNENTAQTPVNLRHLLSHSSGLTDEYGFLGYGPGEEIPNIVQILKGERPSNAKKKLEPSNEPGKKESYSGAGYLIVQLLIEDLTEMQFAEYVQSRVLDPLGMQHTTYIDQPDFEGYPIAFGHQGNGKALKQRKYNVYPEKAAAGPWTNPEDLAKLILGLQAAFNGEQGAILDQNLCQEMMSAQINNRGLGVNLKGLHKPEAFWHSGQNLGYTALLYGNLEKGEGAVVMANSDGGGSFLQEFIASVSNTFDWPVMRAVQCLEVSRPWTEEVLGTYTNEDQSMRLDLVLDKKGVIRVGANGSKKTYPLLRIGEQRFSFKDAVDYYELIFSSEGEAWTIQYTESIGRTLVLKRN